MIVFKNSLPLPFLSHPIDTWFGPVTGFGFMADRVFFPVPSLRKTLGLAKVFQRFALANGMLIGITQVEGLKYVCRDAFSSNASAITMKWTCP